MQEDRGVKSPCPVLRQPSDGSSGGVQVNWQGLAAPAGEIGEQR